MKCSCGDRPKVAETEEGAGELIYLHRVTNPEVGDYANSLFVGHL